MKYYIITALAILYFTSSYSQQTKELVLVVEETNIKQKNENILFSLSENMLFRYSKSKHEKRYVTFDDISENIVELKDFQDNISIKQDKAKLIKYYKGEIFTVFIYRQSEKCQNEGVLYEVERMVPIHKEID